MFQSIGFRVIGNAAVRCPMMSIIIQAPASALVVPVSLVTCRACDEARLLSYAFTSRLLTPSVCAVLADSDRTGCAADCNVVA